ncbi:hypothetical protein [Arachidicoccus ginsenosidivorans]|uniref:hypothetical protein n=1 Tax=Arachidicoccus ginsenosidivorans TaxID=496057 RepID=UPI0013159595|nr:hypothetical protein [Arachidicoccus ginsenosidivorans]
MSSLLLKIDDLVRCDHSFLDKNDECYYFHEFIARGGYEASDSNSLISNFKKDVGRRHLPEWKYKEVAINRISELLIETVPSFLKNKDTTFVPIPPSKTKCNPEYDDRLIQVLFKYKQKYSDANLKELLFIKQDVIAVHTSSRKEMLMPFFKTWELIKRLVQISLKMWCYLMTLSLQVHILKLVNVQLSTSPVLKE